MFEKGALKILKQDHNEVEKLLKNLTKTDDANEQEQIRSDVATEIMLHSKIEEEIFYPALERAQETSERTTVKKAYEEHDVAEKALNDLLGAQPGTETFQARAEVVKELVLKHAKEEEAEIFALAKKQLTNDELETLGDRIEARKRSLRAEIGREVVEKAV